MGGHNYCRFSLGAARRTLPVTIVIGQLGMNI